MRGISPLLAVFSRNLTAWRYSVGVTLFLRINSLRQLSTRSLKSSASRSLSAIASPCLPLPLRVSSLLDHVLKQPRCQESLFTELPRRGLLGNSEETEAERLRVPCNANPSWPIL